MDRLGADALRRAIEDGFPIVEINQLAVPERNSFKPIYQMHKWFARRASCVFRAIVLGCLKPAGTDIMAEFYKDHDDDPDTAGKVVLDPFMGGGTTVVEALRLGCNTIGVDLNPVAWFIVKTEVASVALDELLTAFERLAERRVPWSGESVRRTLLAQYKTKCPCCGSDDADIIYTFWVKSAVCTNPAPPCERKTLIPLFSDYLVAQKAPSIRYWRDVRCPGCEKSFDWETEPATLVAESELMAVSSTYSAGIGRTTVRWSYSTGTTVRCPWCAEEVTPRPGRAKKERKKVPLAVLFCPFCESIWQWRGELTDEVSCPVCYRAYRPSEGNVPDSGKSVCPTCGNNDTIIHSIRRLPDDELLPMHPYAIQGYCSWCCGKEPDADDEQPDLPNAVSTHSERPAAPSVHACLLTKGGGKFFSRVRPADLARYQAACATWEQERDRLPHPKSSIPEGFNTNQMIKHHYRLWYQMFTPRQLLCLSTLLASIADETDQGLRELLLCAFSNTLEANNVFTRNIPSRTSPGGTPPAGIFARHDYQPKLTFCEQNVWGTSSGNNTFTRRIQMLEAGLEYAGASWENRRSVGGVADRVVVDSLSSSSGSPTLMAGDSRLLRESPRNVDCVITDPPFAGNVNYAELADFFYVWLRLGLASIYPQFVSEYTPKAEEILENPIRGKSLDDFRQDLTIAFTRCREVLAPDGIVAFTFHHAEGDTWVALLRALCDSGFAIESVYPVHAEREASLHLQDKQSIAYDLIHVCRVRESSSASDARSWAGIRQEVRRSARAEIRAIEAGRYGRGLSAADINIILIGKCLELYSRHYGSVLDHEGRPFELGDALKEIRNLVDQLVSQDQPLPSELEDIDAESRIYLIALCDHREIKSDDLHKATRGVLEPKDLTEAGLITKGRAGRGRTYEVKQPAERIQRLIEKFRERSTPQAELFAGSVSDPVRRTYFVDYIHLLMALAEGGEPLAPWLERFRGETPRLRVTCDYLSTRNKAFAPVLKKIRDLFDVGPLFR